MTYREPIDHELKCNPDSFADCLSGAKRAELRKLDRDFRVNDTLTLRCFAPHSGLYTGGWAAYRITHILAGPSPFGLEAGFGMLSISGPIASKSGSSKS